MHQGTPGHKFEAGVIHALRREYACEVFTSENLDIAFKVDGEIRRIRSRKIPMPVQVQLTRRIDHYGKLSAYLGTRILNTNIVSLYVEVHDAIGAREAAEHVVWAAQEVQHLPPYGRRPIFGLMIDDDAAFFDPHERLRELRNVLQSAERIEALKPGTVYKYEENGFWIMDDAEFVPYFAHYIDAFESNFRRRLRTGELQIPVKFLPVGQNRATDVRFMKRQQRPYSH